MGETGSGDMAMVGLGAKGGGVPATVAIPSAIPAAIPSAISMDGLRGRGGAEGIRAVVIPGMPSG